MSLTAERQALHHKIACAEYQQPHDYWRLQSPHGPTSDIKDELERRGYSTGNIKDPAWLRESLIRSNMGQTSYVLCTNDELRGYIAARKIDSKALISPRRKGFRSELIELLDKADQNPQFHKFMDLPPEIRNRIYDMYYKAFEKPLHTPAQPPLVLASSQLRREALQLFYNTFTFVVTFELQSMRNYTQDTAKQLDLTIPHRLRAFFTSLMPANLAAIRTLQFRACDSRIPRGRGHYTIYHEFEIKLPQHEGGNIEADFGKAQARERTVLEQQVWPVLTEMSSRPGGIQFTVDDVWKLRRAMNWI